jgi:MFS family permease
LLIVNVFGFIAGCLIFLPNFYVLIFVRICQGLCVGFYSSLTPLIIKEISPNEISGTLGALNQFMIAFGVFFGCIFKLLLSLIFDNKDGSAIWQIIFGFTLLTILIQTIVLLFIFPYETPKYLLLNNRKEDAKALI